MECMITRDGRMSNAVVKESGVMLLNSKSFEEEVLLATEPVLVDFYASWCNPCKMLAPVMDEIAREYSSKVRVCKINIEAEPEIAEKYRIKSVPTLILFKQGDVIGTRHGYLDKKEILAWIDEVCC